VARPQDALRLLRVHVALRECSQREGVRRLVAIARQVLREQLDRHIAGAGDPDLDEDLHVRLVAVAEAIGVEVRPTW